MKLLVKREWKKPAYTIGRLYINGEFFSNTLEDFDRGLSQHMPLAKIKAAKVYGETAIPKGLYTVTLSNSPKFKRVLPLILNVKGFTGVRIHAGNTAKDSLGCILVGKNDKVGWISNSRATENKLVAILQKAVSNGEKIELEIV